MTKGTYFLCLLNGTQGNCCLQMHRTIPYSKVLPTKDSNRPGKRESSPDCGCGKHHPESNRKPKPQKRTITCLPNRRLSLMPESIWG